MRARLLPFALALCLGVGASPVVSALAAAQTSTPGFSNAAVTGSAVVAEAERFLGYPYSYTGDSPATGFSCIGFVWYVYHELGMNIPGTNPSAVGAYTQVAESNLEPGDLVFFQGTFAGLYPSHVAIYIGGGKIIHAANPSYGVTISSILNDPRDGMYWQQHYLSAERPWSGPSSGGPGPILPRHHHVLMVIASSLDLLSGPSSAYSVLTVLPYGSKVTTEGWTPGWVRVSDSAGTVGWVIRSGVQRDYGYIPTTTTASHHVKPALWRNAKTVYVYSLNVHTSPSLSSPVEFSLIRGNRVGVVTREAGWAEIKTAHGAAGWVVSQYLGHHYGRTTTAATGRVNRAGHTALRYGVNLRSLPALNSAVLATSNGLPVRVLHWTASWAKVRLSTGAVGWVYRPFLGTGTYHPVGRVHRGHSGGGFTGGRAVYPGVNIHSGPGVGYSIIGGTFSGMRIRVLGYSAGFAHIRTSTGLFGWVEARFIEGSSSAGATRSAATPARGSHATASIRIHTTAGLSGAVIGFLYAGQHVTVLGSSGGWDLIRLAGGRTGYVDAAYIAG